MFIELTGKNGDKFLLNLNSVSSITAYDGETNVWEMNGDNWVVKESYKEVKRLIKEAINEKV